MLYLLHFEHPYHHARHYLGYSRDGRSLPQRIERHRSGQGAKLLAAVAAAGIGFELARTWPDGDRTLERRLKDQKHGPRLCPICRRHSARDGRAGA